jgi:hypothetical protein
MRARAGVRRLRQRRPGLPAGLSAQHERTGLSPRPDGGSLPPLHGRAAGRGRPPDIRVLYAVARMATRRQPNLAAWTFVLALAAAAGCYRPNIVDNGLRCADGGICPEGFHCAPTGLCKQGAAVTCDAVPPVDAICEPDPGTDCDPICQSRCGRHQATRRDLQPSRRRLRPRQRLSQGLREPDRALLSLLWQRRQPEERL